MYSFIQEDKTGDLFMAVSQAVGVFSYQTKTFTLISGSTSSGFQDGPFSEVQFDAPVALSFLNNRTLLVSDEYNHRLRVLDLNTNTSFSICSGEPGHADGDFNHCSIAGPYGLMTLMDTVYIGSYLSIRRIEGKLS